MATADEKVQDTMEATAEKLAEAAAEAAGAAGEALGREPGDEIMGLEGNEWSFLMRALVAVTVVIVCLIVTRVIRGENPEDKRVRLRNERRAKKKANQEGPDEIDKLLSSIVRRQPGQAPPPGSVPISGRGATRGIPPGGAGRGAGPAGGTSAGRGAGAAAAAAGRGGVAGRGPPPPPGGDNRPKLRWDQNNEEVEIVVRVDPKVARSDVKVEVTSTMLKLSLRNQPVIAGHLFKTVDPEGCTWQIEDPGPGYPKEVMITLLKAEPTTRRENWWRAPLKGLENRGQPRPAPQPADPEMVRKAIEAINAKAGAGAKPGVKLGAKPGGTGQTSQAPGTASSAATSQGTSVASGAAGATAAAAAAAGVASPAPPAGQASAGDDVTKFATAKANKGSGKKKNRKKK